MTVATKSRLVPKPSPEDTRARIMEAAETLFRRLGYAKTTVADIAGELGMSPANVYRFFPSKSAIVEAICHLCLTRHEEEAWATVRGRGTAAQRIENLVLSILTYHMENLIEDQRVHDIVLVACEENWDAIQAHKRTIASMFEQIVRDGIDAGEFETVDPRTTAAMLMHAFIRYLHPIVIADSIRDHDIKAEARASVQFTLRAITRRE